ncbi:hypothetical protein STENM223S_03252 [Streptomyces tendae]
MLAEAVLPGEAGGAPAAGDLNALITALAFTLQPQIHPALRAAAERYLAAGPRTRATSARSA